VAPGLDESLRLASGSGSTGLASGSGSSSGGGGSGGGTTGGGRRSGEKSDRKAVRPLAGGGGT
jgi:hypothetical protein